jgi:integrase
LMADSCASKRESLRVRLDNPAAGVRGPDRGAIKAKQWLYPSEVQKLLACERVPRRWRILYALATYLYLRPGELAALEWSRVFLDEGYVDVQVAIDLKTGTLRSTPKTKHRRRVPIHPNLRPLLEALRTETSRTGLVVQHAHDKKRAVHGFPPLEDLASTVREHLIRAGVDRADLFEDTATTKRLTFYDMRATGITWEVLSGTEHTRVMQRAGHERFETTLGYIREAEVLGQNLGAPFPPLPASLLGPSTKEGEAAEPATSLCPGPNVRAIVRRIVPARTPRRRPAKSPASFASPTGFEPVLQP